MASVPPTFTGADNGECATTQSADTHFAPGAQQREIQAGAHRLRPEFACQVCVALQLWGIATHFFVEKGLESGALVRTGLEVHHPANAAVDEGAIDHSVDDLRAA